MGELSSHSVLRVRRSSSALLQGATDAISSMQIRETVNEITRPAVGDYYCCGQGQGGNRPDFCSFPAVSL